MRSEEVPYLYPAIAFAASYSDSTPLALIEIGTSAGLNLIWDKYRYSYGGSEFYGDLSSAVLITSSFKDIVPAILNEPMPHISHRIGVDINIIDISDADQITWLRALVWPEHEARRRLLDTALKLRSDVELTLYQGGRF